MSVGRTGLGFAGAGWLGESLIRELPGVPGLELVGVQDARLEVAQAVSERHGAPWYGQRFEDLLGLPGIDAVVICTPNALHVPQSIQALRAGKDVLVQKPLALSLADAEAALDVAQATGRLLFVDYTYRFLDTVAALREALPRIGRVQAVRAAFHNIYGPGTEKTWFLNPRLSGGGALVDLGVHLLDMALWLLQPTIVDLEHVQLERSAIGIEREAELRVRLDHSVPFDLAVSWNAPLPETQISVELQGEHGRVRWENVAGSFFRFRTLLDDRLVIEQETTLRLDTLRAFSLALETGRAPVVDPRVYGLLDQAYARE